MKIRNIQTVLAVTILTIILTSNVQATECLQSDETGRTVRQIKEAFQAGGFLKVASRDEAEVPAISQKMLAAPSANEAYLAPLTSEGYLTGQPVKSFREANEVGYGKVVLINKCLGITAAHNLIGIREMRRRLNKQTEDSFYGSFGIGSSAENEFGSSDVKFSIAYEGNNVTDVAILLVAQPEKVNGVTFAENFDFKKIKSVSHVLSSGPPSSPSDLAKYGARAVELYPVKVDRTNITQNAIRTQSGRIENGQSGGAIWIPEDDKIKFGGLVINEEASYTLAGIAKILSQKSPDALKRLLATFKDPKCI